MKQLLDLFKHFDDKVFMERISDLKLDYELAGSRRGADECYSVWKLQQKKIRCLINQYPKEWLVNEIERDELLKYDLADLRSLEPWWKLILGNKALLPLLWQMYPDHENLLPAYYDDPKKSV